MGREAICICEWNGVVSKVKALLEPPELILRGDVRRKVPFAAMDRIKTNGDELCFNLAGDKVCLSVGAETAAKWARSIQTPPPSLAMKLGIVPGAVVRIIGKVDDDALRAALTDARLVSRGNVDVILARVNTQVELSKAFKNAMEQVKRGSPIWIIYLKGKGHSIGESDVRSTGLSAGIVDVKVCSVSEELTGLKFMMRKSPRSK